jgi:hypothetical protein
MKDFFKLSNVWVIVILPIVWCFWILLYPYGVTGGPKDMEIYDAIISKKDVTLCEKVRPRWFGGPSRREVKLSCYQAYVRAVPNENACQSILDNWKPPSNTHVKIDLEWENRHIYNYYALCIEEQALAAHNPTICLQISDSDSHQESCVERVALSENDSSFCDVLKTSDRAHSCHLLFPIQ